MRAFGLAGLAALALAGCAFRGGRGPDPGPDSDPGPNPGPGPGPGLGLAFEMVEEPAVFDREGMARSPDRDAPGGYWALVPGLERAETAVVRRRDSARAVTVALFRAPRRQPEDEIVLSEAAAAVLDIGASPTAVRVTAVREEAELVLTANRF